MSITATDIKIIEEITTETLSLMKVSLRPEVSEEDGAVRVNLVGEDTSIIIGFHGETLADLSYVLGIAVRNQLDKNLIIRVDAGDYMKAKDSRIQTMADEAITKVQTSGFPERLSGLNSYERRLVHSTVEKAGLVSESTGQGKDRLVIIKPKIEE
jgi:spoIIIJ-associated protein